MRIAAVVKRRLAFQPKSHGTAHRLDAPDERASVPLLRIPHGHEIGDLGRSVGGTEAGDKHVGGGPVVLLPAKSLSGGKDAESAALGMVEKGAKDAGRIKTGKAEPVN